MKMIIFIFLKDTFFLKDFQGDSNLGKQKTLKDPQSKNVSFNVEI